MPELPSPSTHAEKPLPPPLDEFRSALQDEIDVAKQHASSSAVPLNNGRRIGEQGSAFQYAFLIDSVLNAPDGAPSELVVPEKATVAATIVCVEGLRIVISVETDFGEFVPSARLITDLTFLMRKLIHRIEDNATSISTAASRMLGMVPVSGRPQKPEKAPNLNKRQMQALESALGRNLTVVWGPPGTGKTHIIGTIAQFLHSAGRTVLIVSHTNNAVDQATKHVASAMPEHLKEGTVIRVGEVRDDELKSKFPDVLLKRQIELQSQELMETRDTLSSQKQERSDQLSSIQQKISIIEWAQSAQNQIPAFEEELEELHKLERELSSAESTQAELEENQAQLVEFRDRTSRILELRQQLTDKRNEKSRLDAMLSQNASEGQDANRHLKEQERRVELARRIIPLREDRAKYPSAGEQKSNIEIFDKKTQEASKRLREMRIRLKEEQDVLDKSLNSSTVKRLLKGFPSVEQQQRVVSSLFEKVNIQDAEKARARKEYDEARSILGRIMALDHELSQYEDIGDNAHEEAKYGEAQKAWQKAEKAEAKIESDLKTVRGEIEKLETDEKDQAGTITGDAKAVYQEACERLQQLDDSKKLTKRLRPLTRELRQRASSQLSRLLVGPLHWDLISHVPDAEEEMLSLLSRIHQTIADQHKTTDVPALNQKIESLRPEIEALAQEIEKINTLLAQVERSVIAGASVIGATLTKVYLSDDIQARRFDTVILDEASMAPIPALWAAARLSDNNLIIVGDFKQLPPIVLSPKERTKKWLGRDIFEVLGVKELWQKRKPPDYFIALNEQRRMLPEIAEVANLFYDGLLRTSPESPKGLDQFSNWYNAKWKHDSPVVLVDTGSLNAWVTSVVKGGNSSRLNFLSATAAVDLAEQLLMQERAEREEGSPKRILIIAPYRAHAKLVSLLLRENRQLRDEVIAGTAHSLQGSEADAVIFDLVADEPHWRVNLFMPELDETLIPLLNVGLTRAKFRLFILGDFSYCKRKGKKAFLGKTLLPFLMRRFPLVDASQLLPEGLAARAAEAQMIMMGGAIEPGSERLGITQDDFFRLLPTDLHRAKARIIIFSPFMTQTGVDRLKPQLQAAADRGVAIFIITKAHSERNKSDLPQIRQLEAQLSSINAVVLHKKGMHEKFVFIDDDIRWLGSLNPLSFSNTQEFMERLKSPAVLKENFQTLRVNDLLSVHGKPESKCPICGGEMIASEGAKEPFYWRCVKDNCFTRSIDQPYPVDGLLACAACNAPVRFGYWDKYPHWRCTANKWHRQKIRKSHLGLPRMVDLIPKQERKKVRKLLHVDDSGE